MIQNNINVEAIRTIDAIIETPKTTATTNYMKEATSDNQLDMSFEDKQAYFEEHSESIVVEASEALESVNTELTFEIHEGTGRHLVKLVDKNTKEIVREIPPEKMLDIVSGIWEWAGIFVDRKE